VSLSGLSFSSNFNTGGLIHISASDNVMLNDSVMDGNLGSGLVVSACSNAHISGVNYTDNFADWGGAIRLNTGNENITIKGVTVTNNHAVYGSGIYIGTDNVDITIHDCSITNNVAQYGAGVYVSTRNSRILITSSAI
jgi:Right handed beta helix region